MFTMKHHRGSRFAMLWLSTGSLLCILSSAFLLPQCSRRSNPSLGNLCTSSETMRRLLPKQEENEQICENKNEKEKSNSFWSISTRIYMVGPLTREEERGLVTESVLASPRSSGESGITGLAQGLLCPETINKMDMAIHGGKGNAAVKAFLDRYHKFGPMSCMELLSDPEILPHLTTTMRDLT